MSTIQPIKSPNAPVACYISIYPFEGGPYHFSTVPSRNAYSGVLSCTVEKNIRNPSSGTFSITLSPGGPLGVKSGSSWTEVLTPMSLAVIGMSRGMEEAIVMIGFVLTTSEQQVWNNNAVTRIIRIDGADFSYLFTTRNYFNLSWLAGPGAAIYPNNPNAGFAFTLSQTSLQGTPDHLAQTWFTSIMLPILKQLLFKYQKTSISFEDIVGYIYQTYSLSSAEIPFNSNFISSTTSWMQKFLAFFPFPFYEYFVYTTSVNVLNETLLA